MTIKIRKAERKSAKLRLLFAGGSGSGKTYSALLCARAFADWKDIVIIDTENSSSDLYAHLGDYMVVDLDNHSPEAYIEAIKAIEDFGAKVIIIDSISHEWEWCTAHNSQLAGNSFTNWAKTGERHNKFVSAMLNSKCHIIATSRTKQEYVIEKENGRTKINKLGLKTVQRDGIDYEFTIMFDVDSQHFCTVSKDRTGLFVDKPSFVFTTEHGNSIVEWCNNGTTVEDVKKLVLAAESKKDLISLWKTYPSFQSEIKAVFTNQKNKLDAIVADTKSTPIDSKTA